MSTHVLTQATALGAMGIALVVALVDHPKKSAASATAWPTAIEAGADHITPTALAERLLADPHSVLLVDVRPALEFETFHLPGAVNLDLNDLLGARGDELLAAHGGELVVLCSNGMTHPGQAWVEFARRGRTDVRVLEDGLDGFVRDVLTPPSLRGATSEARATHDSPAFVTAMAAFLPRTEAHPEAPDARMISQKTEAQKPAANPSEAKKVEAPAFARLATDPAALTKPTIVSTAWVAKRGAALVVLDAREKFDDFAAGHIPGARHAPVKATREDRDGVPDQLLMADKLVLVLGRLGIDNETEVVVYGDVKLQDPAHLALALISVGHEKVAIVEGGLQAWKAEGRAISAESSTPTAKIYVARPSTSLRIASLDDVKKASSGSTTRIVDVRPTDSFRGDVSTEVRAGHIPHSLNRPSTADVATTENGIYWRPIDDLRREYEALGLNRTKPVIVTCRTGHLAAQTWFTMRYVLGYEDVSWYDGSWKEWAARSELPVEVSTPGK